MFEGVPLFLILRSVIEQILDRLAIDEGGVVSQLVAMRQPNFGTDDDSMLLHVGDARGPDSEWADAHETGVTRRIDRALITVLCRLD